MISRIILYGGTFDPIHNGHLKVAEHAVTQLFADRLIFVPAKRSPFKKICPHADGYDRLEMIRLAIKSNSNFAVSDYELKGGDPSFTIETVEFFSNELGNGARIYLLVGADGAKDIHKWYRAKELLEKCTICLMVRPGYDLPDLSAFEHAFGKGGVTKLKEHVLRNPLIDVSSTEIRQKLAQQIDISDKLPPAVLEYIKTHHLYGA